MKNLTTSVAEAESEERRKAKKAKRAVDGFSDYEDMARRKYKRLIRTMKPDLEQYEADKERLGADFFPDANSLSYGLHDKAPAAKIDHMVKDLAKQYVKLSMFERFLSIVSPLLYFFGLFSVFFLLFYCFC